MPSVPRDLGGPRTLRALPLHKGNEVFLLVDRGAEPVHHVFGFWKGLARNQGRAVLVPWASAKPPEEAVERMSDAVQAAFAEAQREVPLGAGACSVQGGYYVIFRYP